jgi:Predicted NTPase (NACHT family)
LYSVLTGAIEDMGVQAFGELKQKKTEQKIANDLKGKIKSRFEEEKVKEHIDSLESEIRQSGFIFSQEDKEVFLKNFFDKNPELKYTHSRAVEEVITKCIDEINRWGSSKLGPGGTVTAALIKRDGQRHEDNIIREVREQRRSIDGIRELLEEKRAEDNGKEEKKAEYFEKIQNLYRIQNYLIRRRGKAFFAEQRSGIIRSRALVLPVYSEEGELSIKDLGEMLEVLNGEEETYQYIHIVTSAAAGSEYKTLLSAYKNKLEFFDERDIISGIMDFTGYLNDMINRYRSSNLYSHYIDVFDKNTGGTMEDSVRDFLADKEYNAFLILGDYGCGKTSFLLNLSWKLAEEFCREESSYIPVFIPLKEYAKAVNLENLFLDLFVNKMHMPNVSIEAFKIMLKYMKFVLLFDGFDEAAKRVNYDVKFEILNQICRFCNENTKIVITCRPNYFQEKREYKRLIQNAHLQFEPDTVNPAVFCETYIADFSPAQVHAYLSSYGAELERKGLGVGEMENFIENTHDLTDLSRRPFLLYIIIQILPQILSAENKKNLTINAASLYKNYTDIWLDRENSKGKTLIRKEDKLHFCKHIAFKMFRENNLSIHFSQMPSEIKGYFKDLHQMDEIDYFSHDIQSCSFMNSEGDGNFKFIHKSFMEYFAACYIADKLWEEGDLGEAAMEVLSVRDISREIALFVNDILSIDSVRYQKVLGILKRQAVCQDDNVMQNVVTLLSKMEQNMAENIKDGGNYTQGDFSHSIITRRTIRNVDFTGATFYNAQLMEVRFVNCCLDQVNFQNAYLDKVDFSRQSMSCADMSYAEIENCVFSDSSFTDADISHAYLYGNNFEHCDMSGIRAEKTRYRKNYNYDSAIGVPFEMV